MRQLILVSLLFSVSILNATINQTPSNSLTYASAGVDIHEADTLIERIKPYCEATRRPGWSASLGSYGTVFELAKAGRWKNPLLISGTDGVGTKLLLAQELNRHDTVGIDLVAMSANDILSRGAEPLFFLDYYASGRLNVDVAAEVIKGIAKGCELAGCALVGGETAEMPQMYEGNKYDLAGVTVGAVDKDALLPKEVKAKDILIGIPSSGLHSNGFSLVRKIIAMQKASLSAPPPFKSTQKTLGEVLLTPTKIYVQDLTKALQADRIQAIAHITGSGITGNLPRVYRDNLIAEINLSSWQPQPIFSWIAQAGPVSQGEMLNTFNCGIGMILIVRPQHVKEVLRDVPGAIVIGSMRQKDPHETSEVSYIGSLFDSSHKG